MKKEALLILMIVSILIFSCVFVSAEVSIPDDLLKFYSHSINTLTLSNDTFTLYDNDRTVFYYMYYNGINATLNVTTNITCQSKVCPPINQVSFDYLQIDDTLPYVKKALGVFILTNGSSLGSYDYLLTVKDSANNFSQEGKFSVTVISSSLWIQFWHNIFALFGF